MNAGSKHRPRSWLLCILMAMSHGVSATQRSSLSAGDAIDSRWILAMPRHARSTRAGGFSMRRVILQEFVTIDGMAAGPDDSVDFVPAATSGDQSFGQRQLGFMDSIDVILLGRVTYEMFAGYWPDVSSGDDKPFADKLNTIPKVVFSKTLDRAPWGKWTDATIV